MEMEEREKDEAAAQRAKAKAERATGTRRGTSSTARAFGNNTENEGLLYSDFYCILKIR